MNCKNIFIIALLTLPTLIHCHEMKELEDTLLQKLFEIKAISIQMDECVNRLAEIQGQKRDYLGYAAEWKAKKSGINLTEDMRKRMIENLWKEDLDVFLDELLNYKKSLIYTADSHEYSTYYIATVKFTLAKQVTEYELLRQLSRKYTECIKQANDIKLKIYTLEKQA